MNKVYSTPLSASCLYCLQNIDGADYGAKGVIFFGVNESGEVGLMHSDCFGKPEPASLPNTPEMRRAVSAGDLSAISAEAGKIVEDNEVLSDEFLSEERVFEV